MWPRFLRKAFLAVLLLAARGASGETVDLTESRVIDLALEQNLSVLAAGEDREIAKTAIQQAKSVFDTQIHASADHLIDKRDQAIPLFGTDNRTTNFNLGAARAFPSGTRLSADWLNERNSTNSAFASINPSYESTVDLSIRQPILKNAFGQQDRGGVRLARKHFERIDHQSRRRVLEAVYRVLFDYWAWVSHRQNAGATSESVTQARRFEHLAGQKKIFGLYETTDVLAARANRLEMENLLTVAQRERDDAAGRLKRGLNLDADAALSSGEPIPVGGAAGHDQARVAALANRSDYAAAKAHVEARQIEISLAKNRKWPEVDLVGSLKLNGVDSGYGNSLGEVGGADHPAYLFGGEFSWSLENRFARGEARRAEHESRKALFELKDVENQVVQEVDERWREAQSTLKQLKADREIERVQREKWVLELEKYGVGRSSSDFVIRYQEDYLAARRRTIATLFQHRMAVLGLKLAEETLVEK